MISLDFEAYSEAGYWFDTVEQRWRSVSTGAGGLPAVGAEVYAMHPTCEVLVACYDGQTWVPGMPPPFDLLNHVREGGLVRAWNSMFEWLIWEHVCRRRYGWPELPLENMRDAMAQSQAFGLPGGLAKAAIALDASEQKDTGGKVLIRKLCVPRSPTKTNPMRRNHLAHYPEDAQALYRYCAQDVRTEAGLAAKMPELSPFEIDLWKLDQRINARGVAVDVQAVGDCQAIVDGVTARLTTKLRKLTGGAVGSAGEVAKITNWCADQGTILPDLTADTVRDTLKRTDLPSDVRWVLEIRRDLGSASVKKLAALKRRICSDGRVRGMFAYCGAARTGRWAGRGTQPHNLPRGSAKVARCTECGTYQSAKGGTQCCPTPIPEQAKWSFDCVPQALESFTDRRSDHAIKQWGDPFKVIGGCLRSMFVAGPGKRLIASDFCAIEAVVNAAMAGEEWRLDVFRTHGKIYEMSAAKITGKTLQFYADYKRGNNDHHPDRQSIGKVAELASGYGGSVLAWRKFGAHNHFPESFFDDNQRAAWGAWCMAQELKDRDTLSITDWHIRNLVYKWRDESPHIVSLWAALEWAALSAIRSPGTVVCADDHVHVPKAQSWHRNRLPIKSKTAYHYDGLVLRCYLPSGRPLCYHQPRIGVGRWGGPEVRYMGENDKKQWCELSTYGGKLTENVVQAVARDLMAYAMLNVDRAGYDIVLHVHDEIVAECEENFGSVEQLESLMGIMPEWAADWPIKASGGWIGDQYRKD